MAKYTTSKGEQIFLESTHFASGGEGSIFKIVTPSNYQSYCAKMYIGKYRNPKKESKIKYMVSHPPTNIKNKGYLVCWPEEILYENGKFVGFLMPLAFSGSEKLYSLCLPNIDKKLSPIWQNKYDRNTQSGITARLKLCVNIAIAIYNIHKTSEYVLVDMKPQNLLMTDDGRISMTDMDSIQISNNSQSLFPAQVATLEYVPPEGAKLNPSEHFIPESWDRFSMAVIFYEILFGLHPFTGTFNGPYQNSDSIDMKIKSGLFVHGSKSNFLSVLPPLHKNFDTLPQSIRTKFIYALDVGHSEPFSRPSAEDWGQVIFNEINKAQTNVSAQKINIPKPPKSAGTKTGTKTQSSNQSATNTTSSNNSTGTHYNNSTSITQQSMFASPFKFEGRIRRSEYGISYIIITLIQLGINLLVESTYNEFYFCLYIPTLWLIFAQGSKRCHDINKSGWFQLIPFYILWMLFVDGDKGDNQYGNDPKR